MRYLRALLISEPEDTPDVTGVTFVIAPTALVTANAPCVAMAACTCGSHSDRHSSGTAAPGGGSVV